MNKYRHFLYHSIYASNIYKMPLIIKKYFNKENSVLFVTYHRVLPKELIRQCCSQRSMIVSVETFRDQLKLLTKFYRVISLEEYIYLRKNEGYDFKKPYAIINFDDGWADNYLFALEELRRLSLPATIYLSSGFVGTNDLFWPEELTELLLNIKFELVNDEEKERIRELTSINVYNNIIQLLKEDDYLRKKEISNLIILYLKEYSIEKINLLKSILSANCHLITERPAFERLLTWEEVKEMDNHGITFGSHTHSHAILTKVSTTKAEEEISKSKTIIEGKLGHEIYDFSYPNGSFDDKIIELVKKSGYRSAVSGINNLSTFTTPIYKLHRKGINEFRYINEEGRLDEIAAILEWSGFIGHFRRIRQNKYH